MYRVQKLLSNYGYCSRRKAEVLIKEGRVKVNDKVEAAIVIAQRTHHSKDILEVIAPINIRRKLKLEDNAVVSLIITAPHMAV